ncbi:hypothetical protein D9757_003250 [Collybiopsis confluens]|uniref:Major facilitator superfamily (MFS) profile domain-containing protein n=1 Tax=Collybiopsis confluens TaxID=2823264 RepID=A0A8H5HZ48_9AGAR|nr:hypothetical protein D9757_003250 [Collybiopsis confluens]
MLRPSFFCLLALCLSALADDSAVPQKITLTSRVTPPGKSLKRRQLAQSNVPLADFFLGTDLQWFGNITVGTPPQEISVVFDTGSSTLEFASTLCPTCTPQVRFNSSKSSTFVDGGRTSTITFGTGVGVDPVVGDNYQLQLRSATDTVSVGGLSSPNVPLFLITEQTPTFDIDPFSGIQGMGARAQGFFAALIARGLPSLFGLYLTPLAVGNAELTIGGVDQSKFTGNLTFASQAGTGATWELRSPGISVNGKTTSVLNTARTVIFDSGTSNVLFDTSTANAMYALISPDIKPNPAEPGTYGIACNRISSLPAVIDITFTSQQGKPFNLTIPSSELSVGPFANNASLCQTLINAFDGLELVGGSLLKHYYSVWDVGNQRWEEEELVDERIEMYTFTFFRRHFFGGPKYLPSLTDHSKMQSKEDAARFPALPTAARDDEESHLSRRCSSVALIFALNLATFIAALDNTIVATAIPTITSQFRSINEVGWYGSIYMLSMTPLQPTLGKVYKIFNIKIVYISALIIFEIGSIIGASASSSLALIVGRAIAGIGATSIFAGGMAIITSTIPKDQRSLHTSLLQSMFGCANVVGPLLDVLSWRWCFWINLPFGLCTALIVFCCYDSNHGQTEDSQKSSLSRFESILDKLRQLDIPGSVLLISGVICLLLALHWGGTTVTWKSSRIVCLLLFSVMLFCVFGIVEYKRPRHAIVPFPVISHRLVCTSALYVFFLTIGRFTHIYYLPFYFQTCKGSSPINSGLQFLPYSLTATLSTIFLGVLIKVTGQYAPVQLVGAVLYTIGSALIASFQVNTSAGRWIGYQILAGVGAGAGVQTPYVAIQATVDPGEVPVANAIIMFMTGLGGALSVSIAQNIFMTVLLRKIPEEIGAQINGTDIDIPMTLGVAQLVGSDQGIPPEQLEDTLRAFANALDKTFIVPIAAGCLLFDMPSMYVGFSKKTWTS